MKQRSGSGKRTTQQLSEFLHHQLDMYSRAATAAGVGMLALAQPVEAKVVYTATHHVIGRNSHYILDLNHDGKGDFLLSNPPETGVGSCTFASAAGAAGFTASYRYHDVIVGKGREASALRAGDRIRAATVQVADMAIRTYNFCKETSIFQGAWANSGKGRRNRYLGLKFYVKGQAHYGWARLNVLVQRHLVPAFVLTLTGYAYETIPNKPIIAGQTKGPDDDLEIDGPDASLTTPPPDIPQPATLGALALGAPGLSIWRRSDSMIAGQ